MSFVVLNYIGIILYVEKSIDGVTSNKCIRFIIKNYASSTLMHYYGSQDCSRSSRFLFLIIIGYEYLYNAS